MRTWLQLWRAPTATFAALPEGPVWRALVFASVAWLTPLLAAALFLAVTSPLPAPPLATLVLAGGLAVAASLLLVAIGGTCFHVATLALGGGGELRGSMRLAAYLHGYLPIGLIAAQVAQAVEGALSVSPSLAPFWWSVAVVLGLGSRVAYAYARASRRLSPARSGLAVGISVACLVFCLFLGVPMVVRVVAALRDLGAGPS